MGDLQSTLHTTGAYAVNEKRTFNKYSDAKLRYKFDRPALPKTSIWRRRLVSGLLSNVKYSAVVIQGPAGHGKTTLMRQLLHKLEGSGATTCWLTLEDADNDISRFNSCFNALISSVSAEDGGSGESDTEGDSAVENILRLLASTNEPVAVFIDEFQCITEPINIALLSSVIERSPQNITFYIGSRSVPDLARGRLLITGRIKWITAQELCFTIDEVLEFLALVGLKVNHAEAEEFLEQTGGWPAILQLLQLALKGGKIDRTTLLIWVRGCLEDLTDYLADNVMLEQSTRMKQFLLRTSVLEKICAPLCEAVTGESESAQIIQDLVSEGLFLDPIDMERKWFKYHSVFSKYLRTQLYNTSTSEFLAVHKSAALWYREQGYPEDAIHHAVEAKEFELAADILDGCIPELICSARLQTVDQLCARIPKAVFVARPTICWRRIWAQQFLYHRDAARNILQELESVKIEDQSQAAEFITSLNILKCMASIVGDDISTFNFWVDKIDIEIGDISKFRCFEMSALANSKGIKSLLMGKFAAAREWGLIGESLGARGKAAFSGAYATAVITYAMIQDGHLLHALDRLKRALGNKDLKIQGSFATASISALYGFALYESGNFIDAEIHLRDTIDMMSQTLPSYWLIPAYLSLARASSLAENESHSSMEIIDDAERAGLVNGTPRMATVMRRERIRVALVSGNLAEARALYEIPELSQESNLPTGWIYPDEGCDDDLIFQARMHIHCGDPEAAFALLTPALTHAEAGAWIRRKIKLLVLSALAHKAIGDTAAARQVMHEALKLAAPQSYSASFLDEGPECLSLISDMFDEKPSRIEDPQLTDFMLSLLQRAGRVTGPTNHDEKKFELIEQLTKRELAILKLAAEGATNREIAEQSFVSYNTVKFHMKNLFAKLGANNRVSLIQTARTLKLI